MPASKPQSPVGKLESDLSLASASPWRVETVLPYAKTPFWIKNRKKQFGLWRKKEINIYQLISCQSQIHCKNSHGIVAVLSQYMLSWFPQPHSPKSINQFLIRLLIKKKYASFKYLEFFLFTVYRDHELARSHLLFLLSPFPGLRSRIRRLWASPISSPIWLPCFLEVL